MTWRIYWFTYRIVSRGVRCTVTTKPRTCLTPGRRSLLCGRWWTAVWAVVWTSTWTCCPVWCADWRTAWTQYLSEAQIMVEAVENQSCGLTGLLGRFAFKKVALCCHLIVSFWWVACVDYCVCNVCGFCTDNKCDEVNLLLVECDPGKGGALVLKILFLEPLRFFVLWNYYYL